MSRINSSKKEEPDLVFDVSQFDSSEQDEINRIKYFLEAAEVIKAVARQSKFMPGGKLITPRTIFATNKRLILRDPNTLGLRANLDSIPYSQINNIKLEKGAFTSEIRIKSGQFENDEQGFIPAIPKKKAALIMEIINQHVREAQHFHDGFTPTSEKKDDDPITILTAKVMSDSKCVACGNINHLTFEKKVNMMLCSKCKCLFAEKQDSPKTLFFKKRKLVKTLPAIVKNRLTHELFYNLIDDTYIDYLKLKTKMDFKNAIDIGCRFGGFVKKLNRFGIEAYGIEADDELSKFADANKVEWGYFDENYKSDKKYDLICLTQMLCYLPDSFSILNHAKNMLTDNGVIFIATLNPQSSIMYSEQSPLPNKTMNVLLSKQNFKSLNDNELELIDYTEYASPLYRDLYTEKNPMVKKFKILQYTLKFKKPYFQDPDGEHAFILLKKKS